METNIEIQTAEANIKTLSAHTKTEAATSLDDCSDILSALGNEHEIIRLVQRIKSELNDLKRRYDEMATQFDAYGEGVIYNMDIRLPELKAQLRCRKEARTLYAGLLK